MPARFCMVQTCLRFHSALQSYRHHFKISLSVGRLLIWIRTEQVTNKNWTLSLMHYHLKQNYTSNNVWRHYKHVNSNNSFPHLHRTHHVATSRAQLKSNGFLTVFLKVALFRLRGGPTNTNDVTRQCSLLIGLFHLRGGPPHDSVKRLSDVSFYTDTVLGLMTRHQKWESKFWGSNDS